MIKKILFFLLIIASCSRIEKTEKTESFVEQLNAIPIWTEKKVFDTESKVLYRIPVSTNGDFQFYDSKMKFVSSSDPKTGIYHYRSHNGLNSADFVLSIQSNSVLLESPTLPSREFFRSYEEPIDRVFITNLLSVPIWYPEMVFNANNNFIGYTYTKMIVQSNGTYYPRIYNPDDPRVSDLMWTLISAESPSISVYRQKEREDRPSFLPPPLDLITEITENAIISKDESNIPQANWKRSHTKPADIIDESIK